MGNENLGPPTMEVVNDLVTAATGVQTRLIDYGFGDPVMIEIQPDGTCLVNGELVIPLEMLEQDGQNPSNT